MKFPLLYWPGLPASGIALFPFVVVKHKSLKENKQILNHEFIHLRQQMELLILPFYVFYLINYLVNLLIYMNHDKAYRNIVFEREAYANDSNLNYLKQRKLGEWLLYFRSQI